jgi:membrane-associated HD superfamily phosphohydrolase
MRLPFQQIVTKTKGGFKRFWKWLRKQMEEWLVIKPVKALYMGIVYCAYKAAVEKAIPAKIYEENRRAIADALTDMLNSGDLEERIKKNKKLEEDIEFLEKQLGELFGEDNEHNKEAQKVARKIVEKIQEIENSKTDQQEDDKEKELHKLFGDLLGEKLQKKVDSGDITPERAVEIEQNIERTFGNIAQELEGVAQETVQEVMAKVASGRQEEQEGETRREEAPAPRAIRKEKGKG